METVPARDEAGTVGRVHEALGKDSGAAQDPDRDKGRNPVEEEVSPGCQLRTLTPKSLDSTAVLIGGGNCSGKGVRSVMIPRSPCRWSRSGLHGAWGRECICLELGR